MITYIIDVRSGDFNKTRSLFFNKSYSPAPVEWSHKNLSGLMKPTSSVSGSHTEKSCFVWLSEIAAGTLGCPWNLGS